MAYVDALFDKENDEIRVVERVNGLRVFKSIPATYTFYYEDPRGGRHKDMWGRPVTKVTCGSNKQFQKELRNIGNRKTFESDISATVRCLEENYLGAEPPVLHVGFFDIEVDFDPKRGFASPWDPFAPVTAISVYLTHLSQMITLVIKPNLPENDKDHLSFEAAEAICAKFENTILCNDEEELLKMFLDSIEDCDVLSGWNSKGFDIPYLVNRIERQLGKDFTKKFCLWNQRPKKRKYVQFKKEQETYELAGRVHLDYLELYKKHNPQELHSYRLDFVAEIEVGENKTPYEGSLDSLYKRDFERFIEYNQQDVMLLVKIDEKKRFIELANQLAHTNTVLLQTTMGSVALVEQAIINEAHSRGLCVPNRKRSDWGVDTDDEDDGEDDKPVVGAYVAVPKIGIHEEIACCDINSLYPSALRSLNMGPETLIGQIRNDQTMALVDSRLAKGVKSADVWHNVFSALEYDAVRDRTQQILTVDFEDGKTVQVTGEAMNDFIFRQGNPYCISANGTIFRTDVEGVIPGLLDRWYTERKAMQFKETVFDEALEASKGFELKSEFALEVIEAEPDFAAIFAELPVYIKEKDAGKLKGLINRDEIFMSADKIFISDSDKAKPFRAEAKELKGFWNQRQQARKILLNSLYGALLNEGCRFYDQRIGQSVTLTGRSIAKHMNAKVNELITGEYKHDGDAIIYADTDSSYFTAYHMLAADPELAPTLQNRDAMIGLYDSIGSEVNSSFPHFMNESFNTGVERGAIIKAGRELVAARGLFITKKRYALLVYDKDGVRQDVNGKPGKIKAMGLDLKRADTPKIMQQFLERILLVLLDGGSQETIIQMITDFRKEFRNLEPWLKGTPKKVNGLTGYLDASTLGDGKDLMKAGSRAKVRIPGHVQAALNWNKLRIGFNDNYAMEVTDGQKVVVCRLRENNLRMSVCAYPIDEAHLPQWFKELPFDEESMESSIIDMKVSNLLGVLNWDLSATRQDTTFDDLFSF